MYFVFLQLKNTAKTTLAIDGAYPNGHSFVLHSASTFDRFYGEMILFRKLFIVKQFMRLLVPRNKLFHNLYLYTHFYVCPFSVLDHSYSKPTSISQSDFLHGLRVPIKGKGLGSFINREERNQPKMRKNCSFIECPKEKHDIYIEVTQPIKSGRELYTTYSHGYRIKKKIC